MPRLPEDPGLFQSVPPMNLPPIVVPLAVILTTINLIFLYARYILMGSCTYKVTMENDYYIHLECVACHKKLKLRKMPQ